jgi:hypothetical protein
MVCSYDTTHSSFHPPHNSALDFHRLSGRPIIFEFASFVPSAARCRQRPNKLWIDFAQNPRNRTLPNPDSRPNGTTTMLFASSCRPPLLDRTGYIILKLSWGAPSGSDQPSLQLRTPLRFEVTCRHDDPWNWPFGVVITNEMSFGQHSVTS